MTYFCDLGVNHGFVAKATDDIVDRPVCRHFLELCVHVKLATEPAVSKFCIVPVPSNGGFIHELHPMLELKVHGVFAAESAELSSKVVEILQSEVLLQDVFEEKWVCDSLSQARKIRKVCRQLLVCDTLLNMRAHVVPESAF
jgi:hypothetical protein